MGVAADEGDGMIDVNRYYAAMEGISAFGRWKPERETVSDKELNGTVT